MIVDHAGGLHVGVADGRAYEPEAPRLQVLAHRVGLRRARRNLADAAAPVDLRLAADELPDVLVEGAEFLAHREEGPGIADRREDLELVPDDPRIAHQLLHLARIEFCNPGCIEARERAAKILALAQDREPAQARLHAFEHQELEELAVI